MDNNTIESKKTKLHKSLAVILFLAVIAAVATLALVYRSKHAVPVVQKSQLGQSDAVTSLSTQNQVNSSAAASSSEETQQYLDSITNNPPPAKVLDDKYGVFMYTSNDQINNKLNQFFPETKYQDDGVIGSGTYEGYHRLAAYITEDDPSGGYTYIFATKDYNTFILDTSTYPPYANPEDGLNGTDPIFNKEKVVGLASLPSNFPATIDQGNFILVRGIADWTPAPSGTLALKSGSRGLNFFSEPVNISSGNPNVQDPGYQNLLAVEGKYISANTSILVQDQSGLSYDYTFMSMEEYARATQNGDSNPTYDFNFYKQKEIDSQAPLYKEYGQLFPGGCGQANITYILKNISTADLAPVASSTNGVMLYTLKDPNHPINQEEYYSKITLWKDEFGDINNNEPVPSYQSYVASNPVLIFQDPWGRWGALGEWQYQTGGGCGKPVIYLYPPKPTEVTVKFINPVRLNLDIPAYDSKWDVLANPDGSLHDLQPAVTDCSKINYNLAGSGYAKNACGTGVYPYLYWEGQASGSYPKIDEGWVVEKAKLPAFFDSKLTEIGLNEKEKNDMMAYWVPQLLLKDSPYYRLSFFQTQTMDNFIPMQVSPKPQTTLRIFLDWTPLASLPANLPRPEIFTHVFREGFTLIEWGGLKQ